MGWGWTFGRTWNSLPRYSSACFPKSNSAGPASEQGGNGIRFHSGHRRSDTTKAPNHDGSEPSFDGGGKGTRTPNPLLAKQVRYQLRHTPRRDSPSHRIGVFGPFGLGTLILVPPPEECTEPHQSETAENPFLHDPPRKDVGLPGLEPGTSSLSAKRSNRLSYRPFSGGEPEVKRYPTAHSNTNRLTVTRLT